MMIWRSQAWTARINLAGRGTRGARGKALRGSHERSGYSAGGGVVADEVGLCCASRADGTMFWSGGAAGVKDCGLVETMML